ncbi:MAG: ABC transporter permease [Propionibacteriaceae bacterium]|jgi:ribose transport system permease protein|nr:ABC transporter permease [Propionibacteriaceae bacterium]
MKKIALPDLAEVFKITPTRKRLMIDYMAWVLLVILIIIGVSLKGSLFFSVSNLTNIIEQSAIIGVLAIGQFVVVLTGGIDLSVGANMALMAMVAGLTLPLGVFGSIGATLAAGAIIGMIAGLVVAYAEIPPFIVTFAMMAICRGLALTVTKGEAVKNVNSPLQVIGFGPPHWLVWLGLAGLVWFLLTKTRTGTNIYAVGGNREAARVTGVNPKRILILVYVISGTCGAVAGILSMARYTVAMPTAGYGYEMQTIAAVVLGGISLFGGEGRFTGAIAGVIFVAMLRNILDASNANPFWAYCVIGAVLWVAVILRGLLERIRS